MYPDGFFYIGTFGVFGVPGSSVDGVNSFCVFYGLDPTCACLRLNA